MAIPLLKELFNTVYPSDKSVSSQDGEEITTYNFLTPDNEVYEVKFFKTKFKDTDLVYGIGGKEELANILSQYRLTLNDYVVETMFQKWVE